MRYEKAVRPDQLFEYNSDGLHFVHKNKRNWFLIVFMSVWLAGWTIGGVTAANAYSGSMPAGASTFLLFWLLGWGLGWLYAGLTLLWAAFGSESVAAGPIALTHAFQLGPLRLRRNYKPSELSALRWRDGSRWPAFLPTRGGRSSAIEADYGAKTIAFLHGIERPAAEMLIDRLKSALGIKRLER